MYYGQGCNLEILVHYKKCVLTICKKIVSTFCIKHLNGKRKIYQKIWIYMALTNWELTLTMIIILVRVVYVNYRKFLWAFKFLWVRLELEISQSSKVFSTWCMCYLKWCYTQTYLALHLNFILLFLWSSNLKPSIVHYT